MTEKKKQSVGKCEIECAIYILIARGTCRSGGLKTKLNGWSFSDHMSHDEIGSFMMFNLDEIEAERFIVII